MSDKSLYTQWLNKIISDRRSVFLVLFLITLLIRLPFFFRDYIDRDESTFILVAQSWVNGHLPYTELWDLKPPLVYFFFAVIIVLFGKSFIAIRMAGVLVVGIIAFYTYKTGRLLVSGRGAFMAALGCVYLLSLFGSMQGLMSEHISMVFFMPALYLLLKQRDAVTVLIAGILTGLALMTKLNLAYAAALLTLYLVYEGLKRSRSTKGLVSAILFGSGIAIVILLSLVPYIFEGLAELWWNSVVLAPLKYTEENRYSIFKMAPIIVVVGAFLYISYRKKWIDYSIPGVQILGLAMVGVVLSFVKGGRVNGHYLIQFYPEFLVLLALLFNHAFPPVKARWHWLIPLLLLILPVESYKEYLFVARYNMERGTFFNGEGITVPTYIRENKMDTHNIFFLEYHIGYWLLNALPPTKAATHPSNLCRPELFPFYSNPRSTSMDELRYIMEELRPGIVITRAERRIFDKESVDENAYMNAYLQEHYPVAARVDGAEIRTRSD